MRIVELYKIGTILHTGKKDTVLLACNIDSISDGYISILKEKKDFDYVKSTKEIVGGFDLTGGFPFNAKVKYTIKGEITEPEIGKVLFLYGFWRTSMIKEIIDDGSIIITMNSVYAIHDVSTHRNKKLDELGI